MTAVSYRYPAVHRPSVSSAFSRVTKPAPESMPQIAGVRTFQYQYGRVDGVNAADVRTGSGLNFGYPVVSEHT